MNVVARGIRLLCRVRSMCRPTRPSTVEQVHTAISDEDYWLARLATLNGSTALESLVVDDDQTVRVATTPGPGPRPAAGDRREVLSPRSESPAHRDVETDRRSAPRGNQRRGVRGTWIRFRRRVGRADAEWLAADVRRDAWNSKSRWSAARSRASSRANSPEEFRTFSTSLRSGSPSTPDASPISVDGRKRHMTDTPNCRLALRRCISGGAHHSRGARRPQHAAAGRDDDPARRAPRASRAGRRRGGVEVHRVGAARADRCQRPELGVHRRQGPAA